MGGTRSVACAQVSVVGGTSATSAEYEFAVQLGRGLARRGHIVVCGGGAGVMEAVCRGASEEGGITVGILPGLDPAEANEWVTATVMTGMGTARNRMVVVSGRVVVAVGGRYGTLSEIAFALQAGLPVCATGRWSGVEGVEPVSGVGEALEFVERHLGGEVAC